MLAVIGTFAVTLIATLGVVSASTAVVFTDFSDVSLLTVNGDATNPNGVLRLTPSAQGQGGSAFLTSTTDLTNSASFSTNFSFQIGNPLNTGADGLAFVVQPNGNNVGNTGGGLGYAGIENSLAIEFDTWHNSDLDDVDGNHVGISLDGEIRSVIQASLDTLGTLDAGGVWYAWVDYDGDLELLEVRVSLSGTRPFTPTASLAGLDLEDLLETTDAYVGFTAATGYAGSTHDILTWEFVDDVEYDLENIAPVADAGLDQLNIEATSSAGASVVLDGSGSNDPDSDPLSTDWVGGLVVLDDASSLTPTGTFPLGSTEVTLTVDDGNGGIDTDTVVISVVDTTGPVISPVSDILLVEATSPTGAIVTWSPVTAVDIVDGVVPVSCIASSGSVFALGTSIVVCSASDSAGNSSETTFEVEVIDTTAPEVSASVLRDTLWSPNHKLVDVGLSYSASDTASDVTVIVTVTSGEDDNGSGDGNTTGDAQLDGNTLLLRAERDGGGSGRIYTITVTATDAYGNTSSDLVEVSVPKSKGKKK